MQLWALTTNACRLSHYRWIQIYRQSKVPTGLLHELKLDRNRTMSGRDDLGGHRVSKVHEFCLPDYDPR